MPSIESYPVMSLNTSEIKDELNNIKNGMNDNDTLVNISNSSKKTIDDILESNIKSLEDFVDSKVINIYQRPWTKLEIRLKTIKIKEFIATKLQDKTYTSEEGLDLSKNLLKDIQLSKKKYKVNYSVEECYIVDVTKIKSKS